MLDEQPSSMKKRVWTNRKFLQKSPRVKRGNGYTFRRHLPYIMFIGCTGHGDAVAPAVRQSSKKPFGYFNLWDPTNRQAYHSFIFRNASRGHPNRLTNPSASWHASFVPAKFPLRGLQAGRKPPWLRRRASFLRRTRRTNQ